MATLRVKAGVQPKVVEMIATVANLAQTLDDPAEVWITSVFDGQHGQDSFHYRLAALDLRSHNFADLSAKHDFLHRLRSRFGPEYDVLLEGVGTNNEHYHIEHDPR